MTTKRKLIAAIIILSIATIIVLLTSSNHGQYGLAPDEIVSGPSTNPEVTIKRYLYFKDKGDIEEIKRLETLEFASLYDEDFLVLSDLRLLECKKVDAFKKDDNDAVLYNVVYNYGYIWVGDNKSSSTIDTTFELIADGENWVIASIGDG